MFFQDITLILINLLLQINISKSLQTSSKYQKDNDIFKKCLILKIQFLKIKHLLNKLLPFYSFDQICTPQVMFIYNYNLLPRRWLLPTCTWNITCIIQNERLINDLINDLECRVQKQPFLGKSVLKICCKFLGEYPCRSVISIN